MTHCQLLYVHITFPLSGSRPLTVPPLALRPLPVAGHDHDQVVFAADFNYGRTDISDIAGQSRRFPFNFTGQFVICDHARLGCLRRHDKQIAVN